MDIMKEATSRTMASQRNLVLRLRIAPSMLASFAALAGCAAPATRPALLSIDSIQLSADERVDGFQVTPHGFTTMALCHKPPAWIVSYGNSNSYQSGGFLGGQAKSAADDLDTGGLEELLRMYLVLPDGRPIKLEGIVRLRNQTTGETRDTRLQPLNFKVEPADKCD